MASGGLRDTDVFVPGPPVPDVEVTDTEDGGAVVDFAPKRTKITGTLKSAPHDANLAEYLSASVLSSISSQVIDGIQADEEARTEWKDMYLNGIKLLGLKVEERTWPWPNAAGTFNTTLLEAVVRFQAQASGEMLPASGPVEIGIIGEADGQLEEMAERVKDAMNYYLTRVAKEYYPDFDQMLLWLAIAGSAFRKVYIDPLMGRVTVRFIFPEDLIVPWGTRDLASATRVTHQSYMSQGDLRRLQVMGFYRDIAIGIPSEQQTDSELTVAEIEGMTPSLVDGEDDRHRILEVKCRLNIPGLEHIDPNTKQPSQIPLPYVLTIERDTEHVLRLSRNWAEDDAQQQPLNDIIHYRFMPGLGFYGLGLSHLLSNRTDALTKLERQMIDSGTLANLQGGLVTKGMRITDTTLPIAPGEWREVDTNALPLAGAIVPLPYKEPSMMMGQIITKLEEDAQRIAGTVDMAVGDGQQNAPVGTTVALIDQATKLMSAVHKRLHTSHRDELADIKRLLARNPAKQIKYVKPAVMRHGKVITPAVAGMVTGQELRAVELLPVSDPNVPTLMQRQMRNAALLQLADKAPDLYDRRAVHVRALNLMQIDPDSVLVPDPTTSMAPRMDPASENIAMVQGKPVKAYIDQDHDAHIATHMAFAMSNPILAQINPGALKNGQAHVVEHVALKYRQQMEALLGATLPADGQQLPPEVEVGLSRAVSEATQHLAQIAAAQQPQAGPKGPDPQLAMAELQTKNKELELRGQELQVKANDDERKRQESEIQNRTELLKEQITAADNAAERATQERVAQTRLETEQVRSAGLQARAAGNGTHVQE